MATEKKAWKYCTATQLNPKITDDIKHLGVKIYKKKHALGKIQDKTAKDTKVW